VVRVPVSEHSECQDVPRAGANVTDKTADAYLAALAMEHGCEWWTADGDFARFPGLNWRHVLDPSGKKRRARGLSHRSAR
jgi:predicted nucleic acid-binding protein